MRKYFIPAFCLLAIMVSCKTNPSSGLHKPIVFVSIVPQKYFVDKISNGFFDCQVMVPPGINVHSYEPKPRQMSLLSTAIAYFSTGLEFEGPWLPKFAALSPSMQIIHTDTLIQKIASTDKDNESGKSQTQIGPGHELNGKDPHIWLSPVLVKQQIMTITAALQRLDTAHAGIFKSNCDAFCIEIDSLDSRIKTLLPCDTAKFGKAKNPFLVFHPTWGYFAKDYCLSQIAIEIDGKEPSPQTMKAILDTARLYKIKTVFAQPEYSKKTAEVIAKEIGATVIDADGLAYDWQNNLLTVAKNFATGRHLKTTNQK